MSQSKFVTGRGIKLTMTCLSILAGLGAARCHAQFGPTGPDAFGHMGNVTPYALRDIQATGTLLSLLDDQTTNRSIGFDFSYFGAVFNAVNVSSNGFLSFTNSDAACCAGLPLPGNGPENMIAGAWNDLDPTEGGQIYVETRGPAGSREFIVGYYDIQHNSDGVDADTLSTFEIILRETSNNIELQYADLNQNADRGGGNSEQISAGIQNATKTDGLQVAFFPDHTGSTDISQVFAEGYLITTLTELGSVRARRSPADQPLSAGEVRWFRFDVPEASAANGRFLFIDTVGSSLSFSNDTELGLYDSSGLLMGDNDDNETGSLAQLRFGDDPNGSLGDLPAGQYYLSASGFNTHFGGSNFDVSSTDEDTGTISVNLIYGTELGAVAPGASTVAQTLDSGTLAYYRLEIENDVLASQNDRLVIDTEGSLLSGTNDTEIGLYDATGVRIADDDDDGTGVLSMLAFGAGPNSSGNLAAGTYYLIAGAFNTTFGATDFNVTTSATASGNFVVNLNLVDFSAADFDEDGDVDGDDLVRWRNNFGTGTTHMQGDADGDLDADGHDFLSWQRELGSGPPVTAASAPVPEPATLVLMILAAASMCAKSQQLIGPVEK